MHIKNAFEMGCHDPNKEIPIKVGQEALSCQT
jgi:hypothetical protein